MAKLCLMIKLPYCQYENTDKVFHGAARYMPEKRVPSSGAPLYVIVRPQPYCVSSTMQYQCNTLLRYQYNTRGNNTLYFYIVQVFEIKVCL